MFLERWKRFMKSSAFYAAPSFRVGTTESESITVRLHTREFPNSRDYWDGNWIWTSVTLPPSISRSPILGTLHASELASFQETLTALSLRKRRVAALISIECFIDVELDAMNDGDWVVTARGFDEHRQAFFRADLNLQRSGLPELRRQINAACAAFPIVGLKRAA